MSLMKPELFGIIFTSQTPEHLPPTPPPPTPAAQRQFRLVIPPAALKEPSVWGRSESRFGAV